MSYIHGIMELKIFGFGMVGMLQWCDEAAIQTVQLPPSVWGSLSAPVYHNLPRQPLVTMGRTSANGSRAKSANASASSKPKPVKGVKKDLDNKKDANATATAKASAKAAAKTAGSKSGKSGKSKPQSPSPPAAEEKAVMSRLEAFFASRPTTPTMTTPPEEGARRDSGQWGCWHGQRWQPHCPDPDPCEDSEEDRAWLWSVSSGHAWDTSVSTSSFSQCPNSFASKGHGDWAPASWLAWRRYLQGGSGYADHSCSFHSSPFPKAVASTASTASLSRHAQNTSRRLENGQHWRGGPEDGRQGQCPEAARNQVWTNSKQQLLGARWARGPHDFLATSGGMVPAQRSRAPCGVEPGKHDEVAWALCRGFPARDAYRCAELPQACFEEKELPDNVLWRGCARCAREGPESIEFSDFQISVFSVPAFLRPWLVAPDWQHIFTVCKMYVH